MTIDEIYAIPVNGDGWRVLPNGNGVRLGDYVRLGHRERFEAALAAIEVAQNEALGETAF